MNGIKIANVKDCHHGTNFILYYNMKELLENIFSGEHKYTVGLIFVFGNLAGFFLNMRKIKVPDNYSLVLLIIMILFARVIV